MAVVTTDVLRGLMMLVMQVSVVLGSERKLHTVQQHLPTQLNSYSHKGEFYHTEQRFARRQ